MARTSLSLRGTDTLRGIADAIGVPYSTLRSRSFAPDFPKPVAQLSNMKLFNVIEVARYMGKPLKNF